MYTVRPQIPTVGLSDQETLRRLGPPVPFLITASGLVDQETLKPL